MTGYQYTGETSNKMIVATLVVGLAIVSVAVGLAFALGVFDAKQTVTGETALITVSSDRLDFGSVTLNDSKTRQLVLRNDGDRPIDASIRVGGSSYRVRPEQLLLHPGISASVKVELNAARTGELDDELEILVDGKVVQPVSLMARVQSEQPQEILQADRRPVVRETASVERTPRQRNADTAPQQRDRNTRATRQNPARPSNSFTVVGDASRTPARPGVRPRSGTPSRTQPVPGTAPTAPRATSRKPGASNGSSRTESGQTDLARDHAARGMGVVVKPFDPANSAPTISLSDSGSPVAEQITDEDAAGANPIPSQLPDEDLPDTLPDEPESNDDDPFNDDDNEPNDPFESPALTISGQSTVRLMGSTATFYPQEIGILGTDRGGPLALVQTMQFPTVPLAFGESMLFTQAGATASGGFDASTGQVQLALPLQAVDSDGNAAPLTIQLTTGTAFARNEAGIVVSMSGTPRSSNSGLVRLVGIGKIPVGYRNGGEQHLALFEILASLTFGNSIGGSVPTTIGRIGG